MTSLLSSATSRLKIYCECYQKIFQGQMNQNLDFFSSVILKRRNLSQTFKKKLTRFFFRAVNKSKNVKSTKTADRFTKTFPELTRRLMEGMELKACFVTSLCCVSTSVSRSWGRFWIKVQTLFYLANGQGVRPLFGVHYSLISRRLFVQLRAYNVPQWSYNLSVLCLF